MRSRVPSRGFDRRPTPQGMARASLVPGRSRTRKRIRSRGASRASRRSQPSGAPRRFPAVLRGGRMTPKSFQKLLKRDGGRCLHCGETEALAPNHRANRGMGGSKSRDVPSNLVVLCSVMNGLIESDYSAAVIARRCGWKLNTWDDPKKEPVFDRNSGIWYLLDDEFGRVETNSPPRG